MKDWRSKYEKYHKQTCEISDNILVANWFLPYHIEEFLGRKITEKEYQKIVRKWHDSGMYDMISETVRDWLND